MIVDAFITELSSERFDREADRPHIAVFFEATFAGTLERTISYLYRYYRDRSGYSFDDLSQPSVIVEEFCLFMPTQDAYRSDVELCTDIYLHALGLLKDQVMETLLKKYIEAHTFIYEGNSRRVKRGEWNLTQDVPLFYVWIEGETKTAGTCNAIQACLFRAFEKRKDGLKEFKWTRLGN
jgi:hypothetical protein